jgi:hypothetical protein
MGGLLWLAGAGAIGWLIGFIMETTHPGSVTGNISKGPKTNPETENPKSPIEKMVDNAVDKL